jgi:hypothetical protein
MVLPALAAKLPNFGRATHPKFGSFAAKAGRTVKIHLFLTILARKSSLNKGNS